MPPPGAQAPAQVKAQAPALAWAWHSFESLGVHGVYDMLALRAQVFILEQGPYLDPDGLDAHSAHLLGRDASGALRAYLRIVPPGLKYPEPSIGRVVLAKALRGSGLADQLVAQGVAHARQQWPGQGIRISAQAHLQGFYGRHGFVPQGSTYLEDNIPHIEMCCPP